MISKKYIIILCTLVQLISLIILEQAAYAANSFGTSCGNGVKWEYADGIFTLSNIETFSQQLSEKDKGMYSVAVYSEDGQMIKCNAVSDTGSSSLSLPCPVDELTKFKIKLFFWKNTLEPMSQTEAFDILHIAPGCTTPGYTTIYSYKNDKKEILNHSKATGHNFGNYKITQEASVVDCGYRERTCKICGLVEKTAYYSDNNIARLCMYGDLTGIGKKAEVPLTVTFDGEGKSFNNYALLKYQGHTSLMYDKKNFTLKLFRNENRTQKNKIAFRDWKKEHKYILKANYVDPSICRNIISADIWSEMVACREGHSERLDNCSNYGATDGFPLALYLNDKYIGLYTMTLHRDDDLFDMDDDVQDAIAVTNTSHNDESKFKSEATFTDTSDWEVEFNGLADDTWVKDKVNSLIEFVRTSSDEEFKTKLSNYMDVNSAIDYLIAIYGLGIIENGSKNLTLASYSNGPWIMSLCDMECAFGLKADGNGYFSPEYFLPVYDGSKWTSDTDSLLWDRLLNNFYPEIKSRYSYLRNSVLTEENIEKKIDAFVSPISAEFYAADLMLYPDMPQLDKPATEQICEYINQRFVLLDNILLNKVSIGGFENE